MLRVDFYTLPDSAQLAKHRFCCRLARTAVLAGKRVYVRASESAAAELDALMWEYPREHFLPHARCGQQAGEPVLIGVGDEAPTHVEVLINLGDDVVDFHANFNRVAEVVLASERPTGRLKYRHYRERGYSLFHHDEDNWE